MTNCLRAAWKCMETQADKTKFKARNQIRLNQRGIQDSHVLLSHRFTNVLLQSRRRWPSSCADKCFRSKHMLIIICCNTASVTCAVIVSANRLAKVDQSISKLQVMVGKVGMCARRAFSLSPHLWFYESDMLLHVGLDDVTWKWRGHWVGAAKQLCISVSARNA